jgi:effector-binding domain-containing protein
MFIMKIFSYIILLLSTGLYAMGYDSMHEKTPVGEIRVLNLPQRTALEASSSMSYFSENNGLFRKLFRYISSHDISMTTPVEADINPGKMRFFVGEDDLEKKFKTTRDVSVKVLPSMKVVSIGIRGSYSQKRFTENRKKLTAWLARNKNFEQNGDAYGVYWNGPFVPGVFKRSEVHIPIRASNKTKKN